MKYILILIGLIIVAISIVVSIAVSIFEAIGWVGISVIAGLLVIGVLIIALKIRKDVIYEVDGLPPYVDGMKFNKKDSSATLIERTVHNKFRCLIKEFSLTSIDYHPSKTVYTGATVGGITTGGFHQTEAYYSEKSLGGSGKYYFVARKDDGDFIINKIILPSDLAEKAKSDDRVKNLLKDNVLMLKHKSKSNIYADTSMSTNDITMSSHLMQKACADDLLSREECEKVLSWICENKEEEKISNELREERGLERRRVTKRRLKIASIIAPFAIAAIIGISILVKTLIPVIKYNSAMSSLSKGNYYSAAAKFEQLGDYKDSEEKLLECLVKQGEFIFVDGKIPEGTTKIPERAFVGNTDITELVIPEGVTKIDQNAFDGCNKLTSVTIPKTVTDIGWDAFASCESLSSVYISDIGSWLGISFASNKSNPLFYATNFYLNGELLTDIVIPEGVTEINSYAFYSYYNLKSVTIPSSVTSVGIGAFARCDNLEKVYASDVKSWCGIRFSGLYGTFEETNANPLYYADEFYLNGVLVDEITLPSDVTSIEDFAFYGFKGLKSIVIPENITAINDAAFAKCINLADVTLHSKITNIGANAFGDCESLEGIIIPTGITNIKDRTFSGCKNLKSVIIPSTVTSIKGNAFASCSDSLRIFFRGTAEELYRLYLSKDITEKAEIYSYSEDVPECEGLYWRDVDGIPTPWPAFSSGLEFNSNGDGTCSVKGIGTCKDTEIKIPYRSRLGDLVTGIASFAFKENGKIKSLTIPDSVKVIEEYAFYKCYGLTEINVPDSVRSLGASAFSGCESLTRAIIGDRVSSIGNDTFYNCRNLISVTVGSSVTSISNNAFSGTNKLIEVINKSSLNLNAGASPIQNAKTVHNGESKLINFDDFLFYTLDGVNYLVGYVGDETDIVLPKSLNGADYELYKYVFSGKDLITSLTIEGGVKTVSAFSFANCTQLKAIYLDGVTAIEKNAFEDCVALESVIATEGLVTIGESAFDNCYNLQRIVIPKSVSTISKRAFYLCSKLSDVYYGGNAENWSAITIDTGNGSLTPATRYFYSENEPTKIGNYWYYNDDGEPVIWP